jgi:putative aminopeptidase FrvX
MIQVPEELQKLLCAHATSGDETEVFDLLENYWQAAGWQTERLGHYARVARRLPTSPNAPTVLICAHADSVGFAISNRAGSVEELGSPDYSRRVEVILKTRTGKFFGSISRDTFEFDNIDDAIRADLRPGDRLCYDPDPGDKNVFLGQKGSRLTAPFLDNRAGCYLLTRLARRLASPPDDFPPCNIILGVTALEEIDSDGAYVLAVQTRPDAVIVLDTTYDDNDIAVKCGGGPVLTLVDESICIPLCLRDLLLSETRKCGLPLQLEVTEGMTDARAFPKAGILAPVLPLLIPTRGNHSPEETLDMNDFAPWEDVVILTAKLLSDPQNRQ